MRLLIERGADINEGLPQAALSGYEPIVRFLLDIGADINTLDRGRTALSWAAELGYEPIVRLLIERGANLNTGAGRFTPVGAAVAKGHRGIVELLRAAGANFIVPERGRYSSILDEALEAGVISKDEINNIDERYLCGITQQIMDNPVYDNSTGGKNHGSRFDKETLAAWINQVGDNPETRQPTATNNLREDITLRGEIEEFMRGIMRRMTLSTRPRP